MGTAPIQEFLFFEKIPMTSTGGFDEMVSKMKGVSTLEEQAIADSPILIKKG